MATKSEKSKCRLKFDDLFFIPVASDNNKSFGVNCNCACRPVTWTQCRDGFHNGVCLFISTDIMATDRVNYVWPAYNPSYRCRHIIRVFQWECQNSSKGGQSDFYQTLICCRPWPRGESKSFSADFELAAPRYRLPKFQAVLGEIGNCGHFKCNNYISMV